MSEKLNVCLMNDSFPPLVDGVANTVVNYADVINSQLGSASVATPDFPGAEDNYPYEVVRYKSMSISEKICGYRAGYPFSSSNLDKLSNRHFDVIHCHCPWASAVMARVLREKCGAPIILTYHTKFDIEINAALPNELMAKQATKFIVSNIAACDEVWVVSNGAGENLRGLGYEGKYRVMENGVDFPRGRADENDAAELRAAYGIDKDTPLFIFVGRMLWYKGIRLILDALKLLTEKGIAYKMMFVGDGAERQEIEDYAAGLGISDNCIFPGVIYDREELRVYYTAGDLFLFPSEYDTNGIVVREAAACGVGALLIEDSCAAEGITHSRTGILTQADPRAIAKELEFACAHRDEIRQIGENAMNEVYISWETAVKKAYDRYFAVIENVRAGQTQRQESFMQEEFFSIMDNITYNIQRLRSIPAGFDKYKRKWRRLRENIRK